MKKNSAIDDLTLGKTQCLENAVTVQLPEGKLGVIFRVKITKGPVRFLYSHGNVGIETGIHKTAKTPQLQQKKTGADTP